MYIKTTLGKQGNISMSMFSIKEDIIRNVLFICKCVGLEGICPVARDRSFVATQEFVNERPCMPCTLPSFRTLSVMCTCAGVANGCCWALLLCTAVCGTSAESMPWHRVFSFTWMKQVQVGTFGTKEKNKPEHDGLTQTP